MSGFEALRRSRASYFGFSRVDGAIAELDGLRAIAILLVLFRHAILPARNGEAPILPVGGWDAAIPFINGWIGVDLFFVLSGFLITRHLLRRMERAGPFDIFSYLSARALRIVPTYFAVLALVVAGAIPFFEIGEKLLALRVGYHLLFLQDYLPANIVVAFWSLGVEEKFYILAPFIMFGAYRSKSLPRRYCLLVLLVIIPSSLRLLTDIADPGVTGYIEFFRVFRSPFHLTFDGLAIGVLCAFLQKDRLIGRMSDAAINALFWTSSGILILLLFPTELLAVIDGFDRIVQQLAISLAFGGVLVSVITRPKGTGFLSGPLMLIIARISYPLYLIHMPLVPVALYLSGYHVGDSLLALTGYLLVFVTLCVAATMALHYAVEKPFLILKDAMRH